MVLTAHRAFTQELVVILTRGADIAEMFYVHALGCSPDPARHARGASMHVNVGVSCACGRCVANASGSSSHMRGCTRRPAVSIPYGIPAA